MNSVLNPACNPVETYVAQLPLHCAGSRRVYRCVLNGFQRFMMLHTSCEAVSLPLVEGWVRECASVWAEHMVIHRACMVSRFLDWQVVNGLLPVNPIEHLRQEYGSIDTTSIVRALLATDPGRALNDLRPQLRFGSFLGPQMRDHVALMRAVGHRYVRREASLLRFDRFLQNRPDLAGQSLGVMLREWTETRPTVEHAWECLTTVRVLAKALHRVDPTVAIPAPDPRMKGRYRDGYRHPHIFSEEDVRRLFLVARSFRSQLAPSRPPAVYLMLVLAYCAGLRVGEIARLTLADIDMEQGTIDIRETKFFKSRRLPMTQSVMVALREYLEIRRRSGAPTEPAAALFWHTRPAGPYSLVMVSWLLREVIRRAGFKPSPGRVGPRPHDLRHAFVVHRMLAWYREGVNPQSRLPYLATYLGHKDINSTLVYLTITQDLLHQANQRFHAFAASVIASRKGG